MPVTSLRQRPLAAGARIAGLGTYRPAHTVSSEEVGRRFGRSGEWVTARTGIRERRVAAAGETVADLAAAAGAAALAEAGLVPGQVELLLVATCSPPDPLPSVATQVGRLLGASASAAFDLNAACSGFCSALAVAAGHVHAGTVERVLVIGTEKMTSWIDPDDLPTAIVFGDGAGAAVVTASAEPGIGPVVWGSDGSQKELIAIPEETGTMRMAGQAVFRWATAQLPPLAQAACGRAGVRPDELAAIVPHQANLRIIDSLPRKIGAPDAILASDVETAGNTSGASIPLALHRLVTEHPKVGGGLALLVGFGAGLTYAAQVVRVP